MQQTAYFYLCSLRRYSISENAKKHKNTKTSKTIADPFLILAPNLVKYTDFYQTWHGYSTRRGLSNITNRVFLAVLPAEIFNGYFRKNEKNTKFQKP